MAWASQDRFFSWALLPCATYLGSSPPTVRLESQFLAFPESLDTFLYLGYTVLERWQCLYQFHINIQDTYAMRSNNFEPGVNISSHAIVVGGSITGLLSARVLLDSFELVTIIETDRLPTNPNVRQGVPQSTQPHVLFAKGYRILEYLFPNIGDELSAAGALPIDWVREFHHFDRGGWSANAELPSDIVSFTCSRPLLEWIIRRRLSDFPKVQFVEQHRVTGLLCNDSQTQINGVRLRSISGSTEDELLAALVVDASGRRSQAPHWLESLGFTPPLETVINPFLSYATRRYREPKGCQADWKVMLISHSPPQGTRLGYLVVSQKVE